MTLGDVMTEALIDVLADTVAAVKAKTLYESLNDIMAATFVKALKHTWATHCPMWRRRHRPIWRLTN